MSRRGGGQRGGGRRGGDYRTELQPNSPSFATSQQRGGRRGGGDVSGRGGAAPPPPSPPVVDLPSSSSSSSAAAAAASSSLSQNFEQRLSIREPTETTVVPTAEAEVEVSAPAAPPPVSSKALTHPRRPGFGTVGRKCIVRANHFIVQVADLDLCHYDVAITPEVTSKSVSKSIISELVKLYRGSHLGKRLPAYDGRKSLYTAGELPFSSKEFVIKLPDKDKKNTTRREREFKVTIKLAGRPSVYHLQQFLQGRQSDGIQETIQALDIVLREPPSAKYITFSRSFYSPVFGHRDDIGDGLECWRGYYQSLRPVQMGLSLNIDISATSFYKPISIVDFVAEYLNIRDIMRPLSDANRVKVKKALRGIKVQVTHRPDSCRQYKITGISSMPMNQLMFPVDEQGTRISVVQYFRDKYKYSLKYVSLPCLQAGSDNRPTYLPMEVCKIVEGQRYTKKLNKRQVTAILRSTSQRPSEREQSIVKMVNDNNFSNDLYAKEFGIQLKAQLASVEARVLPPPKLKYHESGKEKTCNPSVGQWNMINKRMVNGGTVDYWTCLNLSPLEPDVILQFCHELVCMCSNIGMVFNPNPLINIRDAQPHSVETALKEVYKQSTERLARQGITGKELQLLIVVLPEISGIYGRIKRLCETDLGIVSQCCLLKHVSRINKQYLENVALKINVKVGGRNTVLEDAIYNRIPLVTDKPTIIFGADVTHPAPGEDSTSSIAAVVASMDWPEVTKYRCLVSAQSHRKEIIEDLGAMFRELLIAFRRATNYKPHRIIFYRDGVSEGQFSQVLLYEMDAIRKACASLENGYLPPVTFVVVQKRHHTRLFPTAPGRDFTDRSGNILAGTVVDTKICHPTEFDFYLCSHAGIQGTSRPTHYHVLFDENRFSADGLQMLTNNLCYTYARCTKSVSIVPPAYYAHLAAFRARYYAEGDSSDGGSTSAGGGNTHEKNLMVRPLPKIKDNVKDVMFYC